MPDHPLDTEEVSEQNISELFNKDTRECSDAELLMMIEKVRAARHLWEQEERTSKSKGTRPRPSKGLSLKDLDLKL